MYNIVLFTARINKNNMKQTAVEWLVDELILEGFNVPKVFYDKAKAMEKEQIMSAFTQGDIFGADYYDGVNITEENYYNKTFKSE
jgi:hypothetical protein